MSIGNRTILEKADLSLGDLTTDGGLLVPAQAKRFIRIAIDESTVMPMSRVVPMKSHTQLIEKARFASRVLRAGTSGQALSAADRSKLDLSKEELNAQLFKGEVRLNNEVLEDSLERQNLRSTVIALMAERVALDMDEVVINGDTVSTDPFLAKFDGIIKQASVNVVDNLSAGLSKTTFKNMLKAMPSEFLRNKKKMRFLVSIDGEIEYRDTTAARETVAGDRYLENDVPATVFGVPIIDVPLFPEDLGGGNDESVVILTDPKNINVGIWRKVTLETDKDISAGVLIIVVSLRFDTKFTERTATVKAINVKVG